MITAKIQSVCMAVGFVTFLAIAGMSIGLTIVSTFMSGHDASASQRIFSLNHCTVVDCESEE